LFKRLTAPKPPLAMRLGTEQLSDKGALGNAHEICD